MNTAIAESILENRKIVYAVTDRELTVQEVSGAVGILCHDYRICLGRSLLELVPELAGSEGMLAEILDGELPRFELTWVNRETAEGQTRYVNMVTSPRPDGAGEITGVIHMGQDVTRMGIIGQRLAQSRNELRLLRDRLARRNRELAAVNVELQRLDEVRSTFVSVAAHELRSPLTSIQGYVEMLLDGDYGPLTEAQRERLEIVRGGAHRLLSTTDNLLNLTRIEAGQLELVLQPRDLTAVVKNVINEFEPQLEAKEQQLTLRTAPDLPLALCDETRARQIIGNLLSNAIKYTPPGGQITIELEPAERSGFLQVSVADTGVGIADEDQRRLFNRFFRGESAQRTEASGTGLGLYIARSLIQLHGGRVWFESEPDSGSTFYVTFPVATD
jgi:PAS domain S-box-containing protein